MVLLFLTYAFFAYFSLFLYRIYFSLIIAFVMRCFNGVKHFLEKMFIRLNIFSDSQIEKTSLTNVSGNLQNKQINKYFDYDRFIKYGFGLVRMGLMLFFIKINSNFISLERLLVYIYLGFIGAIVNVKIFNFNINMMLLTIGGVFCINHIYMIDSIILLCLAKTFVGDIIAGKIDTIEWKSAVLFTLISLIIHFTINFQHHLFFSYECFNIFITISLIQLITELGDNYLEHYIFFRHRYSFELMTLVALYMFDLNEFAKLIIFYDLIMCFCYRLSNFLMILFIRKQLKK